MVYLAPPMFSDKEIADAKGTALTFFPKNRKNKFVGQSNPNDFIGYEFKIDPKTLLQPPFRRFVLVHGTVLFVPRHWMHAVHTSARSALISIQVDIK